MEIVIMRFKRQSALRMGTMTRTIFGGGGCAINYRTFLWILVIFSLFVINQGTNGFEFESVSALRDFNSFKIIGLVSSIIASAKVSHGSPVSSIQSSNNITYPHVINSVPLPLSLQSKSVPSSLSSSSSHPRRLTKLPKGRSGPSSTRQEQKQSQPESAVNRARLLLGSLNRQNCFAKVLCGLGARPPSTKTDLVNDYVYLMEELMVDDDYLDKSKSKGKGKGRKGGSKPYTKNDKDDSDSSQSKQSEEDADDKNSDWGFMADQELIGEDPQVLKYMRLEKKKKKYKHDLPGSLLMNRRGSRNYKNSTLDPISIRLQMPRSTRKLARKMADAVKDGRTFIGNRRQCRTIFDSCPFDDVQMNEIIGNLKKIMTPQAQQASGSKSSTKVTASGDGSARVTAVNQPQGSGSKVEIILHLNQNGMPYQGAYQMGYNPAQIMQQGIPGMLPPTSIIPPPQPSAGIVSNLSAPVVTTSPQTSMPVQPIIEGRIPTSATNGTDAASTTMSTAPSTTTPSSPADEQLLDFLYGVVNFNESEPLVPHGLEQNPPGNVNPYWSIANSALKGFDDIEQKLHLKQSANGDEDDDSRSSEEIVEIKQYLKSLKETLQGLAQMNNASVAVEQKFVKQSSEEDTSSAEDVLDDDDLKIPGISNGGATTGGLESEEDKNNGGKDKVVGLKHKGKKKKDKKKKKEPPPTFPPASTLIGAGAKKPQKGSSGVNDDPLFDDDNEDNETPQKDLSQLYPSSQRKKIKPNREQPEDDEYEPEESSADDDNQDNNSDDPEEDHQHDDNEDDDDEQDDIGQDQEDSDEKPSKSQRKKPNRPKIKLKFDPITDITDADEMTDKEKRKLLALSNVLLPTVSGPEPLSKNKKRPVDILEEIRIPTVKPVANEFQLVSNFAKSGEIINIDEFAENSGKTPKFPKRKNKKGQRPYSIRYQNRRRQPMTRPLLKNDKNKSNDKTESDSSEELEEEEDDFGRSDSPQSISSNSTKPKKQSDNLYQNPRNPTLVALPMTSQEEYSEQQHDDPQDQQEGPFNLFGSVMNMMGMKPVQQHQSHSQSHEGPFQMPYYRHETEQEYFPGPNESPYYWGKSDTEEFQPPHLLEEERLQPKPKIAINIPLVQEKLPSHDEIQDDLKGKKKKDKDDEDGGDGDGKKDGKKKDKKDDGKKDKKKKKSKKSKKKKNKGGGSTGFSTQFHQQVYPAKEQGQGIWDKIKGFVENLGQSSTGETPFIHLGFSEKDPLDGGPHSAENDAHHGPPKIGIGPPPRPFKGHHHHHHEEEEEEEEEDDIGEPEDVQDDDQEDEGVDSGSVEDFEDDNDEKTETEESTSSIPTTQITVIQELVSPSSAPVPLPVNNDIPTQPPTLAPSTPKTTIAPKFPKYKVNRNQLASKKKKRGPKPTVGPPITLFSSTTPDPPSTAPTTIATITSKAPKRRIFYKPPSKVVNVVPGSPLNLVTTARPSTTSRTPSGTGTGGLDSREEDDEKEPPAHFFQPGPKGQNVRGRPPIPIDAFHIQSEDMLFDSQEEKFRSDMNNHHHPRHPYPMDSSSEDDNESQSREAEDDEPFRFLDSREEIRRSGFQAAPGNSRKTVILESRPPPHPAQPPSPSHSPLNPNSEETRGSKSRRRNKPLSFKSQQQEQEPGSNSHNNNYPYSHQKPIESQESTITTAVMSSPLFSDYFKHLYTKFQPFGQYFRPNSQN